MIDKNNYAKRGKIKGDLFEIVILHLLIKNGFTLIDKSDESRVKEDRKHFIELKGRGEWHQIDCPMDCDFITPFMFPIRLLGEVKFFKGKIEKDKIREYIGVIKDIQENYFADTNVQILPQRYIEIGAFFSANGFSVEAEHLAYAHGIRTISYENNFIINDIKRKIEELESYYIDYKKIEKNNYSIYLNAMYNFFDGKNDQSNSDILNFCLEDGYQKVLNELYSLVIDKIKASFIGYSDMGLSLHFLGKDMFPYEIFDQKDESECKVYMEHFYEDDYYFCIMFTEDHKKRKFYFTPPKILVEAAKKSRKELLQQKNTVFHKVNINLIINGVKRTLTIKIDNKWLLELLKCKKKKNIKK